MDGELFLPPALKHCRGPECQSRLLFFTPCCPSRMISSEHMASSTSMSWGFHLCPSPGISSLLPWGPTSRVHTLATPSCSPSHFQHTHQKPSYPRLLSLTHLPNPCRPRSQDSPSFEPPSPRLYFPCNCFGSRTTCPMLMHGLLIDLWACTQSIPHTKTRMTPKHTPGDVIFLLKVLQNLPHNLQDQVQTPSLAQHSPSWFSLYSSPRVKQRSRYTTCQFTPPCLWTYCSLCLDCCPSPPPTLCFLLRHHLPLAFIFCELQFISEKCNSVSGNPLIHPVWSSSKPLLPPGTPPARSLHHSPRGGGGLMPAGLLYPMQSSFRGAQDGSAWPSQCLPLISLNE